MGASILRTACTCTSAVILRAGVVACATCGAPVGASNTNASTYSQRDGERPAGASRVKYLRTWKAAHAAGDVGAWSEGRSRLMDAECWARWAKTSRVVTGKLPAPKPVAAVPGDALLEAFGATRKIA